MHGSYTRMAWATQWPKDWQLRQGEGVGSMATLQSLFQDNSAWQIHQDEQIMAWATHRPEDWQLGGKCDAWLWGGGRHGQLCETGRGSATPQVTPSFKAAQQVLGE